MPSAGSDTAQEIAAGRPRSLGRRLLRAVLFALMLVVLAVAGGFPWFVHQMPAAEDNVARDADGIVVLTGAALRINDALELLAAGHGRRLLITGVNPQTRSREIARLMPEHKRWFDCCVDLDHSATNTITNAVETRRWTTQQKFGSLIVVTSNFHMPRAMAELGYQLPNVTLIPFPVISERVRVEAWYTNPSTARLLFWEYLKYVAARIRMRVGAMID
jgi:uncharacterized SAM-binding protein YcdF (DUF218 family)